MINTVGSSQPQHKYSDPLNKNIFVLMNYSNEFGTAISEIAPKTGAALWAPTFLYLGADIYDKYKNDKENYNPSTKRALKRAVFQGVTSLVAMPAVILAGQYLVSPLGRIDKSGISGNAKEAVYRHTKSVIDQAHGTSFTSFDNFYKIIKGTLKNKIKALENEKNTTNFFKRTFRNFFTHKYDLLKTDKTRLFNFAENNARNTYNIMIGLKTNSPNVPAKILKKYKEILPMMKNMYGSEDYAYQATRFALKEYQKSLIFKNKLLKTAAGFITMLVFAKPVNNFVEKNIMKKYINPGIDQISKNIMNESGVKRTFNELLYDQTGKS